MTPGTGSLELAHARIAARWGARADEALWQRIEAARALDAVLALVRCSPLAGWVGGLDAQAGLHEIDRQMHRHWQAEVTAVATWLPEAWQPALHWCATAADLPLAQHLRRGGRPPAWLDRSAPTPIAADGAPEAVWPDWLAGLRQRLPSGAGRLAVLHGLLPLVEQHRQAFAQPGTVDGWALRRQLAAQLVRLWRRHPAEPVGGFIHLALTALEGERLRGELARRAAFPAGRLAA